MRKLTHEQFVERSNIIHNNKYEYPNRYVSAKIKIGIKCPIHGLFSQIAYNHMSGLECPECYNVKRLQKLMRQASDTPSLFINKANIVHNMAYNYDKVKYIKSSIQVEIFCPKHNLLFMQTPAHHLSGQGCRECASESAAMKNSSNIYDFKIKAENIHGNNYDYSRSIYVNNNTKIIIKCNECNYYFEQQPNNHLHGQGCSVCSGQKINTSIFIERSEKIHNNLFDYSKVNYIDGKNKVIIICNTCKNEFKQSPLSHLQGAGCFNCAHIQNNIIRTKTQDQFILEANQIHGDKYDYSKVKYINTNSKIIIICNKCNSLFDQLPNNHLSGKGCAKCCNLSSKPEADWLNYMNVALNCRHYKIKGTRYVVDGYNPETNTIYEFYGDFWHGNPKVFDQDKMNKKTGKTFGELYKMTINKENMLKEAGYKIVSIWESDWKNEQKNIK